MTTKDQERKALEKIRKIVEELGEDSYIGMALEGCIDDAEQNIENDWALSMKGRWQDTERKMEAVKERNAELKAELEEAEKHVERMREKVLDRADMLKIRNMLKSTKYEMSEKFDDYSVKVLEFVDRDEYGTEKFSEIVRIRRESKACYESCDELIAVIDTVLG